MKGWGLSRLHSGESRNPEHLWHHAVDPSQPVWMPAHGRNDDADL